MKKLISLFYLLILTSVLFAHEDLLSYAKVLFDDGQYSSSQSILTNLSSSSDVTAEILYLNAKCSKELFLSDAILLYDKLEDEFPFHQFKDEMNEDLALIYYRQKQYNVAISYLQKINTTSNNLKFKLAYSYFCIDSLNMAKLYFSEIMKLDSKFAAASQYYYAFISYQFGLYKSALYEFKQLLNDEKFGNIVTYYITQIYFYNK